MVTLGHMCHGARRHKTATSFLKAKMTMNAGQPMQSSHHSIPYYFNTIIARLDFTYVRLSRISHRAGVIYLKTRLHVGSRML